MEKKKIQDVCIVNPHLDVKMSGDMKVSFLPMTAVSTDGRIDLTKTLESEKIKNYSVFQNGDVLFAKITPCMENGKGAIADNLLNGYGAGSTEFIVLRPKSDIISSKWLFLYLSQQSFRQECKQHMTGSAGQKRVQPKYLASCTVPVPPLPEQKRIVARIEELFSELDKAVETLNTTKQQLAVYRQAVYSSIFETIKDMGPITDYFDISGGVTKNSKRNDLKVKRPYLRVANVYYNHLDLTEVKEIGVTKTEEDKCLLKVDDLLFVEGNGSKSQIGRVAIWRGEIPDCVHQNHIIKGRPLGNMLSEFALYYLMSKGGRAQILKIAKSTSGLYTLSTNKIKGLQIPYCDLSQQRHVLELISQRLSVCDQIEKTIDQTMQKAEALRQSILKKAFEGRI